ncbi:phosphate-selective porin OprO and OprP [Novimethylophilus kurashikiensis]|uniref:Phosphate-selective porin OprO and OprP n=1 Tax=Novimethylophilus kurashikiensis TaxID=1825523 RepID=A0A2R5F748_9PROT|nr:porin [Novimethylophilus kurashikiensis]GBG12733.1 phosphate-selective porin OprO and OprP [Novimethylophilus kurashikiensis]
MNIKKIALALSGAGIALLPGISQANDSDEMEQLRALVQELKQEVKGLKQDLGGKVQALEKNNDEIVAKQKDAPIVKASEEGFGIKSADGQHEIKLRGQIQVDGRFFPGGDGFASGNTDANEVRAPNTFLLKQFRPILQGTVFGKYDFLLVPDFGNGKTVIQDAYVDARLTPWFQVKAGKQKVPFGLERLQGDADGKFIERGLTSNIAPNRDIGVQVHGMVGDEMLDYALGYFDGALDGSSTDSFTNSDTDNNSDKDFVARVFSKPFKSNGPDFLKGLGFGLAATYSDVRGRGWTSNATASTTTAGVTTYSMTSSQSNLIGYKSALGQLSFFGYRTATVSATDTATYADGERYRLSPQFTYYNGPFGLMGEYVRVSQEVSLEKNGHWHGKLDNEAWQVVASWMLTGEDASYKYPKVKSPFDPDKGAWGAWELVARYSELDIDDDAFAPHGSGATRQKRSFADPLKAASKAEAWAVGVNWYLNKTFKLSLDYEDTSFDGGWAGCNRCLS